MKFIVQAALAAVCAIGLAAWCWKLTHGMPLTLETAFFTVGSLIGTILFVTGAVEEWRK
jgi:hypothetical protein